MKNYRVTVNGIAYDVVVEELSADAVAAPAKQPARPAAPKAAPAQKPAAPAGNAGANAVKAPMPGNILKVNVKVGESFKKGAVLCVLEAMKMENEIMAPQDGTVASVEVSAGTTVASDAVLLTFN